MLLTISSQYHWTPLIWVLYLGSEDCPQSSVPLVELAAGAESPAAAANRTWFSQALHSHILFHKGHLRNEYLNVMSVLYRCKMLHIKKFTNQGNSPHHYFSIVKCGLGRHTSFPPERLAAAHCQQAMPGPMEPMG